MKRNYHFEQPDRFSGSLRHYHRSVTRKQPSWEDWADADLVKTRGSKKLTKFLGIVVFVLVLGTMIAGLLAEPG